MNGITLKLGPVLSVLILVAALPLSSSAQLTDPTAPHVGEVAYYGHFSVSDVIQAELLRITELDPESEISFKVSIPVVQDGELLVGDLAGLPVQEPEQDTTLDSVAVNIPFNTGDFRSTGYLDVAAFNKHVEDVTSLMTGDHSSTITVSTTTCSGTMNTTYECMLNSATGQNDWYITQQEWLADVDCINP